VWVAVVFGRLGDVYGYVTIGEFRLVLEDGEAM
jgi:hypothetical protein